MLKISLLFKIFTTLRVHNLIIFKFQNVTVPGYYFYINKNIQGDFQFRISVSLKKDVNFFYFLSIIVCTVPFRLKQCHLIYKYICFYQLFTNLQIPFFNTIDKPSCTNRFSFICSTFNIVVFQVLNLLNFLKKYLNFYLLCYNMHIFINPLFV